MNTTTDTVQDSSIDLTITRDFDAPRELVFAMWTSREHMRRWFGPKDFTIIEDDMVVDFRPGGEWFSHFRSANGKDFRMRGVYQEIVAPERIVLTHSWIDDNGESLSDSIITVTLDDLAGKTRLTLHQTPFDSVSDRDSHEHGWGEFLERLEGELVK